MLQNLSNANPKALEWERKFVNINMLLKEKTKRRKLAKLF